MERKWLLVASVFLVGLTSADLLFDDAEDLDWERDADFRSLRTVSAPVTANRIADVMVNIVVDYLSRKKWTLRRTIPSVSGNVPFNTDNGQMAITVRIDNGVYSRMGSIQRSKSASISKSQHILAGTLGFEGLGFRGDYSISSPAVGQAPATSASGQFSTTALKYFVDYQLLVDSNGLPVAVKSWTPRAGELRYNGATNLSGSKFEAIFNSILKDSAKSLFNQMITSDIRRIVDKRVVGQMQVQK